MALTCAQIVSLACQIAKTPGYTTQAGQMLNAILSELAENYDFDIMLNRSYTLTTTGVSPSQGPYILPANYLRSAYDELNYTVNGTVYKLKQMPFNEFLSLYEGPGIANYPEWFSTDVSPLKSQSPPLMYVWPPPSGAYNIQVPYYEAHADITSPQTSSVIPWFPQSTYLYRRLGAELMQISDDTRELGAQKKSDEMLGKYLTMKDDEEGFAKSVKLDSRRFRTPFDDLKPTKQTGW